MKRSCLVLVGAFLAITGVVLAAQRFYPPVRAPGAPPPQDGEIVGVISGFFLWVAVGSLLAAPLSGTPCVTYDYQISHRTRSGSSSGPAIIWHGHGLTPSHVETAAGAVRILGCTGFALGPTSLKGPEVVARATKFCAETTFADSHWTSMRASLQNRKELLADDDGAIKADFGAPATRRVDTEDMFEEHVARDWEEVCAFGRYSAERGGLVPDPAAVEGFPVILWTGGASRVRRKIQLGAIGHLVGALATAAFGAGVLWAWYTLL